MSDLDAARDENLQRLEIATRAAALGVWDWDLRTNEFTYSDRAKEICGLPVDKPVTYEQIRAVTHPDDLPRTAAQARRAHRQPGVEHANIFRYRIIRADTGETRWVEAYGETVFEERDGKKTAIRYVGTLQDVTDQKRAEEARAENEARLRLAIEAGGLAVWELDMEAQTVTHSPELNRICGFPADARPSLEELRSRYAPGEHERIQREGAAARERGETSLQTEFRQLWPDGTERGC